MEKIYLPSRLELTGTKWCIINIQYVIYLFLIQMVYEGKSRKPITLNENHIFLYPNTCTHTNKTLAFTDMSDIQIFWKKCIKMHNASMLLFLFIVTSFSRYERLFPPLPLSPTHKLLLILPPQASSIEWLLCAWKYSWSSFSSSHACLEEDAANYCINLLKSIFIHTPIPCILKSLFWNICIAVINMLAWILCIDDTHLPLILSNNTLVSEQCDHNYPWEKVGKSVDTPTSIAICLYSIYFSNTCGGALVVESIMWQLVKMANKSLLDSWAAATLDPVPPSRSHCIWDMQWLPAFPKDPIALIQ